MVKRHIHMIGAFPPPVQGMAVINQAVLQLLRARGEHVEVIDISAPSLARGIGYHWLRARRILHGLLRLLIAKKQDSAGVYMSVSGGLGQVYEILFALLARIKCLHMTLHHHSYAYLSEPLFLTRLLLMVAPAGSRHVVLSEGMEASLRRLYGVKDVLVLSNAAFMTPVAGTHPPDRPFMTLGFLSNISREKGIHDFIALFDASQNAGLHLTGVIAGPFQDQETEAEVLPLIKARPGLRYVGPQYGEAKTVFFGTIDALVFPTRYVNEAEPVTIHEALMHGVPVIAYGRGAIPEILAGAYGVSIPPEGQFSLLALPVIVRWHEMGPGFVEIRRQAMECSRALRLRASSSLDTLLNSL